MGYTSTDWSFLPEQNQKEQSGNQTTGKRTGKDRIKQLNTNLL